MASFAYFFLLQKADFFPIKKAKNKLEDNLLYICYLYKILFSIFITALLFCLQHL